MPKELHNKLKKAAKRQGLKGTRADAYVYGTLRKVEEGKSKSKKGVRKSSTYNVK